MVKISTRKALIKLFKAKKNDNLSLEEIYSLFPKYFQITEAMKKPSQSDCNKRPRYKNNVRSNLYKLVKQGVIIKQEYNCYYYSKKNR